MLFPILASAAFGFFKGYVVGDDSPPPASALELNFLGPVKEELIYRGMPFWTVGPEKLPRGSTALLFALDHVWDDVSRSKRTGVPVTAWQLVSRFGDTLLGAWFYESAMRESGIVAAVAAHGCHNFFASVGARARGRA